MLPVGVSYLSVFPGKRSSFGLFCSSLLQLSLTQKLGHWWPLGGFWTSLPKKPDSQVFSSPFSLVLWTGFFKEQSCILDDWVTCRSHPLLSSPSPNPFLKGRLHLSLRQKEAANPWRKLLCRSQEGRGFLQEQGSQQAKGRGQLCFFMPFLTAITV